MKITDELNDSAVLTELGQRLTHRRVEAGLTQEDLAREAGVSKRTVERLEAGNSIQLTSLVRVLRALSLLGGLDALLPPAASGPMDLLRHRKPRQRVRSAKRARSPRKPWQWGDES